jgi:hypothetical protein
MRVYVVSAAYRQFLEHEIDALITRAQQDEDRRADEDPRVQALATVPDEQIDRRETGTLLLAVFDADAETSALVERVQARGRFAA